MRIFVLAIVTCVLAASCRQGEFEPSYPGARLVRVGDIEFDDGDTFTVRGERIRVLGIDTPEVAHPEIGFMEDQPYGPVASESTRVWLERAGQIEIVRDGKGYYGRRLAHIFIDGELLAVLLVRHALAYETVTHYGDNGYPDLAQRILEASRTAPKPKFEEPYKWKQKQRKKNSGS